ncbi:ATP-binding protein [Treponema zuelzerae]|uniref:ATP-binding protein n=1 Tax=Teretinema zuelzerae TaxID=156 RepID=A0AAE3EIA0_9SPIR|nr:ATP-binding protein [Teretinema zuelzerae]MCD1655520.1 ATP-binding protein [Teretinema zuelzerae]
MAEPLKYIVEDNTIAELLGVQNFTSKESAILELVKNAYDAQAKTLSIIFDHNILSIIDDGIGMDKETILFNWMHIGKSDKDYSIIDHQTNIERVLSGSKGIGRFALARLGSSIKLISSRKNSSPIIWETDWNSSSVENIQKTSKINTGTHIDIFELRDRWTEGSIQKLTDYLSITYNDTQMSIKIKSINKNYEVSQYFQSPKIGKNFVTHIHMDYNSEDTSLICSIKSDEFRQDSQNICKEVNINHHQNKIVIIDEIENSFSHFGNREELKNLLVNLGNFSTDLYFSLKGPSQNDCERFLYKHDNLSTRYDRGVVLYRNAFGISSFEGEKDWLGFGKRSRKSPAAASHPTGAWRIRENQISGMVCIDKRENKYLKDLSNRQGLEENEYFDLFHCCPR